MFKIILTISSIQVLAIGINFIRTKLVAVLTGPEGVGVISTVDQVVQTVSYFSALSLPFASVKFLSKAHSEGREEFRNTYANFLKGLLALAATGTAVAVLIVLFQPGLFGEELTKYRVLLLIALLGIPAMVLGGFLTNVFAAAQKFKQSSLIAVITNTAATAAIIIGVLTAGLFGLYVGSVAAGILVTIGILVYLRRREHLPLYHRGASFVRELRQNPGILSFSFFIYLGTFTYSIAFLLARYSILKNYGEADAGLLQAAIAISLAIGLVLNPANGLYLTPIMNRNIEKSEKMAAVTEFEKKLAIVLFLVSMPIVLFPELILTVLFSTKFTSAGQFLFVFVISQILLQLAGVHQALLIGFDDLKAYSIITCAAHLLLGVLAWIMAPEFGILGVALAFMAGYTLLFTATFFRLRFSHQFTMRGSFWVVCFYGLAIVLLAGFLSGKFGQWNTGIITAKIVTLALFSISFVFALSKVEVASLLNFLAKYKLKRSEV